MTCAALSAAVPVETRMNTTSTRAATVADYHQRTKHHLDRYAAGPGTLDWEAQPDPFRHWVDAQTLALPRDLPKLDITWNALPDPRPAAPLDVVSLSTLLRLSVGVTAWKEYAGSRWALRANPSSGNLHPTETWVIAAGVQGVANGLHHYHSRSHVLEQRAWETPLSRTREYGGRGRGLRPVAWLQFHPLARGLEIRRTRLPLLPARPRPCAGRRELRRRLAGLARAGAESGFA